MAEKSLLSLDGGETAPTGEARRISLNGREVVYTLKRCRRKSIGMKVDGDGLTVSIPPRETLRWVESVLHDKADWLLKKLGEWENKKPVRLVWEEGATFPLLGKPWQMVCGAGAGTGAGGANAPTFAMAQVKAAVDARQLSLALPAMLTAAQIEKIVMAWYREQALTYFGQRLKLYAARLGVPPPQLRLSRAKTQWGSCDARGIVHLNWRLIQLPLHLLDYVVAHELSHLIEMNHSPSFWKTVESVYPDYRAARKELRKRG